MKKMNLIRRIAAASALSLLLTVCAQTASAASGTNTSASETTVIAEETLALAASQTPAISSDLIPVASGTKTQKVSKCTIDYSNIANGYVMVDYTASTTKKLKVQVKGPTTTYTYTITAGKWTTFPLSDGNGSYTVGVYENVSGTKYSTVASVSFSVTLKDEFAPFIRPNQYVDYTYAVNTVAKAKTLVSGKTEVLDKVDAVYNYVVKNIKYDTNKAKTVTSGYLPDVDSVLKEGKGICFDYAALMVSMLRSQGIPCKLVVGYAGTAYHAWISVYSEKTGWIEGSIYFDGKKWQRMDPTFASTGNSSSSTMQYIGDGSNYTAKFVY